MSTVAADQPQAAPARLSAWLRPLPVAIVGSRLLVLGGAILGTTFPRVSSWRLADPQQLTVKLGSLGNVLAAASVRWDSLHYLAIAQHGYTNAANTVFFPLYPLLIRTLAYITGSYVIAGAAISLAAFAIAMVLLHRLTRERFGERVADTTVLLLAFSPVSLFFTAVYTESLFLALSLAAFMLAQRGRFGWACLAAAAATLTHAYGLLLIAPLAMIYWQQRVAGERLNSAGALRSVLTGATPLLSPLVALGGFLLYLYSRGYGWLAPSTNQRLYGRHFSGPFAGIADGVRAAASGVGQLFGGSTLTARQDAFENLLYLAVLAISVAALALGWRRLPRPYTVFCALFLLVCVSSPETTGEPLASLDRFALVLFPLWIVAAQWLGERRLLRAVLAGSGTLAFVFALEFARWVFFG